MIPYVRKLKACLLRLFRKSKFGMIYLRFAYVVNL